MPARGAETEGLHPLLRDLCRVDRRKPEFPYVPRAELREQLLQTRSTIVDERAKRYDLRLPRFALHVKKVGVDSLVGGDGESRDLLLPCHQGLDRARPANLPVRFSKKIIRNEIVN